MVRRGAMGTALACALAAAAGCSKEEPAPPPARGEVVVTDIKPEGEEVPFLRAFPGTPNGGIREETRAVIRDAKAWEEIWARASLHLGPAPKPPAVDFAKEMPAIAALGEKPTGGWSVEIVGARKVGGRLWILYAIHAPGPDEVAAQVVTRPWHAVVLPASDLPVEWVRYEAPKPPAKRK